jgi:hypothetical protein
MGKSQSESSLPGQIECRDWRCEILRSAQNDNVVCERIRRGEENNAWPGQDANRK